MTYKKYMERIQDLATEVKSLMDDYGIDRCDAMHQTIDGTDLVIYYHKCFAVLAVSENWDAIDDVGMSLYPTFRESLPLIAYCAIEADINRYMGE